jgi:transposase InsO family protein
VHDDDERGLRIAALRYRAIADAAENPETSVSIAIEAAALRTYLGLDGESVSFTARTLWRYLHAYRNGGLLALVPKTRKDRGVLRAFPTDVLEAATRLRREADARATNSIIDILVRQKVVAPGALARSTLDRHFAARGLSRRQLRRLGKKTFRKILTEAPFELVLADFHHGPYVRTGADDQAKKALLLAFIDHFSRYVVAARYYLHEDFAVLRHAFRRLLVAFGRFERLYIDNGPSFQTVRFHAACKHEALGIEVMHSKPYVSEGRGACERFNRTLKEQFESEVRGREELLTLDELNAFLEAWLAERYHQDENSETREKPVDRFQRVQPKLRPAPDLTEIDELLRLRERRTVHKKWSTVEIGGLRYVVSPALRGRRIHVLYDPFDPTYVLIEHDGRTLQRAERQQPGQEPEPIPDSPAPAPKTDYLALLRADYEARAQAELSALRLRPATPQPELSLLDLVAEIETCRGAVLSCAERNEVGALFRKMRPIDPDVARRVLEGARRQQGTRLHVRVYLDALFTALVRRRTKGDPKP